MKKQNLVYLILAIVITAAIYGFFVYQNNQPAPPTVTEDASTTTPNNQNYQDYVNEQKALQESLQDN